jgi:ketosteroid isomerase-like protein
MDASQKESLIRQYLSAYNSFDLDGMVALLHPDAVFQNFTGGALNATTAGIVQFRALAERSKQVFSARCQTMTACRHDGELSTVDIAYEGVLNIDIPQGPKAGETLKLTGKSEFRFRDGLIHALTDYS